MENINVNLDQFLSLGIENTEGIINFHIASGLLVCILLTIGLLACIIAPIIVKVKMKNDLFEEDIFMIFWTCIILGVIFVIALCEVIPSLYFWTTDPMSQLLLLCIK